MNKKLKTRQKSKMTNYLCNNLYMRIKTVFITVFILFYASFTFASELTSKDLLILADNQKNSSHKKSLETLAKISNVSTLPTEEQAYYAYIKGYHSGFIGDYQSALDSYNETIKLTKDNILNFRASISIANIYAAKRDFPKALQYLIPALEKSDEIQVKEHKHNGLLVAAVVYSQMELYQQTADVVDSLLSDSPVPRAKCYALALYHESNHYLKQKATNEAQQKADADECEKQNEHLSSVVMRRFAIYRALDNGDYTAAKKLAEDLLPKVEATRYTRYISEFKYLFATALFQLGELSLAEKELNSAIEMNVNSGKSRPLVDSFLLLSRIKEQSGDLVAALDYYKKYTEADKFYSDDISSQQIAYHLAKGQIYNKNYQIQLLEKNNEVLTLEQELSNTEKRNNQLFIALLIVSLLFAAYFAIKNLKSKQYYRLLAENDNLTGISNRFHFTDKVKKILEGSNKLGQIDSFLIFDLDFFKQINDQYGHLTGDWVLQTVVAHSKQFVRNLDVFGRIGGEEFAIYLPACTAEKAALLAEILRDAISQIDYSGSGHPIKMTASFGVTATDRSGYQLKKLFRDADHALYQSKHQGRNQVSLFEEV